MPFKFEKQSEKGQPGIEITGFEGNLSFLTIPETIEGLPVRKIGKAAFAGRSDLQEVRLPESVRTLCRNAFYNCPKLKHITLHDGVEDYYDGVIRQCGSLKTIDVFLVEDVEARVLHHKIEGAGYPYRECVTRKGIDCRAYDRLFGQAVQENGRTAAEIAFCRLLFPHELEQAARERYESFLEKNAAAVLAMLIADGETERIGLMAERCLIPKEALPEAVRLASEKKETQIGALLLDYQKEHFGRLIRTGDLELDDW